MLKRFIRFANPKLARAIPADLSGLPNILSRKSPRLIFGTDCFMSMYQFGEIQFKFMSISYCVWTLHFTQFALKTRIHDLNCILRFNFFYVTVVFLVQKIEEIWKGIAVLKTHSAAMANFKVPLNFFIQGFLIPIL